MRTRLTLSLLGFGILLPSGLLLRPLLAPATAQTPAAPEGGRYSLAFNAGAEYFVDTRTGRIWVNAPILRVTKDGPSSIVGMHWVETGSPVSKVSPNRP